MIPAREPSTRPRPHPRTIVGPTICQACRGVVVYEMLGCVHLGWLHADGRYTCRGVGRPRTTRGGHRP